MHLIKLCKAAADGEESRWGRPIWINPLRVLSLKPLLDRGTIVGSLLTLGGSPPSHIEVPELPEAVAQEWAEAFESYEGILRQEGWDDE